MTYTSLRPGSSAHYRKKRAATVAVIVMAAFVLGACGGGDDDTSTAADTATSESGVLTTTTTVAPVAAVTTTVPTPTTLPVPTYVTEGATVIVANASDVNGSAGRLSERLAAVGFTTGTAVNSTEGTLAVTKIYYDPANTAAKAVADSLQLALGGGEITVVEVATPPPIDTADLAGAGVLIAMGNDVADKSLDVLQGRVAEPVESSTADDSTTGEGSSTGESSTAG